MNFTRLISTLLMLVMVLGLQACGGGGGGGGTPAAANPIGYYAGTLSTVSPSQTDISAKAIVDTDKFMLVHIDNAGSNSILYVGTFANITSTTFTADVRIYQNGVFLRTASLTNGAITEKSSMSGTLSGTGNYTATSFSLTYESTINSRSPRADLNSDIWKEPLTVGAGDTGLRFDASPSDFIAVFGNASIVPAGLQNCSTGGIPLSNVVSEQPGRIRKYNVPFPVGGTCSGATLIGYITPFDKTSNDDRYLWITYDSTQFFTGELEKQP